MKKGTVKILALSHKNGRTVLKAGDKVTETDVNAFDDLVKYGKIEPDTETKKAYKASEQKIIDAALEKEEEKKKKLEESKKANESAQEVIKQKDEEIITLKKEVESKNDLSTKVADLEKKVGESETLKGEALGKVADLEKKVGDLTAEIEKLKKPATKAN